MDHHFKFSIGESVNIVASGEAGTVLGAAVYNNYPDAYLLRYKAADGRAVQEWWEESALV